MQSDIKLNGTTLTIEGSHIHAKAHDLKLDSPQRRQDKGGPHRRALVHGFNDELAINFRGDYPGGVNIYGDLSFLSEDGQRIGYINTKYANLHLGGNGQDGDIILFDGNGDKAFHLSSDQRAMTFYSVKNWPTYTPGRSVTTNVNLLQELKGMKKEIVALKKELKDLKSQAI